MSWKRTPKKGRSADGKPLKAGQGKDSPLPENEIPGFSKKHPKFGVEAEKSKWPLWIAGGVGVVLVFLLIRGFLKMVDGLLKNDDEREPAKEPE